MSQKAIPAMMAPQKKAALLRRLKVIAPRWAAELKKKKDDEGIAKPAPDLNIRASRCCIVGEAHGFSNQYMDMFFCVTGSPCWECTRSANNLVPLVYDVVSNIKTCAVANRHDQEKAWQDLEPFIEHFNKEHKK